MPPKNQAMRNLLGNLNGPGNKNDEKEKEVTQSADRDLLLKVLDRMNAHSTQMTAQAKSHAQSISEKEEMRLASRVLLLRESIPYVYSNRPNIFRWRTNNQLFTERPAERERSNFLNYSSERMSNTTTVPRTPIISDNNIIWIDMEMTGLDPEKECILEVACMITDKYINIIAEGPNLIIHQPLEKLKAMNDWCLEQHTKSGLFKASLESKVALEQAEDVLLKFVQQYTPQGKCPLAGNSVYMDKLFLLKFMPRICEHLHYRILDVSSVKILAKNWYNLDPPRKILKHRALDDIKESIKELTYYQNAIFKSIE